jgi:anti-sigma regulatory factor (Ser/Thr protein kinase)
MTDTRSPNDTTAPDSTPQSGHGGGGAVRRGEVARPGPTPVHLASWSIGADLEEDPITELEVADDDATPERLRARVAALRALDANRAVAVVHAGHARAGTADARPADRRSGDRPRTGPSPSSQSATGPSETDWRRQLAAVVGCLSGQSDGFTGDTTPTSLARLRRWADDTLRRGAVPTSAASDIVLLVDELASNVEEHAPGWMTVDLEFAEHSVLIVVSDPHPSRMPVPGDPPPDRPNGRGLMVVAALSTGWGVVLGRTSKAVWAEVAWPAEQGTARRLGPVEEPIAVS